jgi:hypothetical protein
LIQLTFLERRDSGSRETMGNAAIEMCRIVRKRKGINSAKFYWYGPDEIVFWVDGEATALDNPDPATLADYNRVVYTLADHALMSVNKRLIDPRAGVENYRIAGR